MTQAQFANLEINFETNVSELVNFQEIEQIICVAGGTKTQREECYHFMTNLISSIVIEDVKLENEIQEKFLITQKEVAIHLSHNSATLVAIGPNATQFISQLKHHQQLKT